MWFIEVIMHTVLFYLFVPRAFVIQELSRMEVTYLMNTGRILSHLTKIHLSLFTVAVHQDCLSEMSVSSTCHLSKTFHSLPSSPLLSVCDSFSLGDEDLFRHH